MNPAKMSAVLLLLVCAVLTRPAGLVFADEGAATEEASAPKAENAESSTVTVGAEVPQPATATEVSSTAAQTTSTTASVETSSSTTTQATTTTSKATEAPTAATAASPAAGLGAHDQVQEQAANISTTPKPTTSTPMPTSSTPKASTPVPTTTRKPNDASLGATLSVATLVIGLCITYL